jgi:hypothetical protein
MTNAITPGARRLLGAAVLTLAVVACSSAGSSPAPTATPSAAATAAASAPGASVDVKAEIDAVVAGLDQALALYKAGNVQGALDEVAATYEDHFEHVEDPLGDKNHDLMEDIEGLISTKLRAAISGNQPAAAVEALVTEAKTRLATAKALF